MKNPYTTLEIPKDASPAQVRRAYRKKAARAHPDNQATGNAAEFVAINAAHRLLADPQARKIYDATGMVSGENKLDEAAIMLIVNITGGLLQSDPNPDCNFPKAIKNTLSQMAASDRETIKVIERTMANIQERWKGAEAAKSMLLLNMEARLAAVHAQTVTQERAKAMLDGVVYEMPALKADSLLNLYFGRTGVHW